MLLPSLALGGATAWHMAQRYRETFEQRLADTARALALAMDAEIGAHLAALRSLAGSPDLDPGGDLEAFRRLAEPTMRPFGSWVVVSAVEDRRQLLNTALPPGAPLPNPRVPQPAPLLEQAIRTGEPTVLNLLHAPLLGRQSAAVVVPVVRDGRVVSLLAAPILLERLAAILAAQGLAQEGFATLVDGRGLVAARSVAHERHVGGRVPDWFPASALAERGLVRGPALDGRDALIAYQRLAVAPAWRMTLGVPLDTYRASWLGPLLALAAGGTAALAFAVLLAAWLARRTLRPVQALVRQAERLAQQGAAAPAPGWPAPSAIAEFEVLRIAGERAEVALRRATASLRESEARFRLVAENAPIMLWMGDERGKCLYLNQPLREFWGVEEADLAAFDWGTTVHPEDAAHLYAEFGRGMRDRSGFRVEARYRRADGAYRVLLTESRPRFGAGGAFLGMIGVNVDVTDARAAEAALVASERRHRLAQEAGGIGAWELDLATGERHWSASNRRLWGIEPSAPVTLEDVVSMIHPDDRARALEAVRDAETRRGPLPLLEIRIIRRSDGALRWIQSQAEAIVESDGRVRRHIGIMRDVTEQKEAFQRLELLMRELDHRAKNALTVVQATLRLTPRDDPASFVRAVEGRVKALARAHTLLAEGSWRGSDLRTVAQGALAPFLSSVDGPQAACSGPPVSLAPAAVQALSMAFHELATNAAKHGALSVPAGRVRLAWEIGAAAEGEAPELGLDWTETGGPPLASPPGRRGFGSTLVEATISRQLGGRIETEWLASGLRWTARIPLHRIAAASDAGAPLVLR